MSYACYEQIDGNDPRQVDDFVGTHESANGLMNTRRYYWTVIEGYSEMKYIEGESSEFQKQGLRVSLWISEVKS